MTFFDRFTRLCFAMALGALAGLGVARVTAQTPPTAQPPPSCESQLAEARKVILQLRKDKAAAEWQLADALQETVKLQEAAKVPTPTPAPAQAGK